MRILALSFKLLKRNLNLIAGSAILLWLCLTGLLFTQLVRISADAYIQQRAHESLAADIAISAFRPLAETEHQLLLAQIKPLEISEQLELMTMISTQKASLLVEVKGIDSKFPLYGSFSFKQQSSQKTGAFVYPEVLTQLNLKLGDILHIGRQKVPIVAILTDDPGFSQTTSGIAPKIYIPIELLKNSGLTQMGSQVVYRTYYKTGGTDDQTNALADALRRTFRKSQIFIRTPDDGLVFVNRALDFFRRYVGILALLISGLAILVAGFQLQKWLDKQIRMSVIFLGLGASQAKLILITGLQLFVLLMGAWALAWISIKATAQLINHFAAELLPKGLTIIAPTHPGFTLIFTLMLFGLALLIFLKRLQNLSPITLLQESAEAEFEFNWSNAWVLVGLSLMCFAAIILEVFDDPRWALWFSLSLIFLFGIVWSINLFAFRKLALAYQNTRLTRTIPLLYLSRLSLSSLIFLVFSYLVVLALTLVPQLRSSVLNEFTGETRAAIRPSLFLMNIIPEDMERLNAALNQKGFTLLDPSPFILAQLRSINNKPPVENMFRRFPVRLSYRAELLASEKVIAGLNELPPYTSNQARAWMSVEQGFANRNGFKLGDIFKFDVQGVEIEAEIKSLRRVDWASFQPNFFFEFQPGVLDMAPKTFIGTLKLRPGQESELQFWIAKNFPGLSIINITQTIERILDLVAKIILPVQILAALTIFIGLFLLAAIVRQTLIQRLADLKVFQAIGASPKQILSLLLSEYSIMMSSSLIGGAALGGIGSWAIMNYFMQMNMTIDIQGSLGALFIFATLSGLLVYQTARSVVRTELRIKS